MRVQHAAVQSLYTPDIGTHHNRLRGEGRVPGAYEQYPQLPDADQILHQIALRQPRSTQYVLARRMLSATPRLQPRNACFQARPVGSAARWAAGPM